MWPGQMCMCVSNRDRRGFVRFIGTWTGWCMNRNLNCQTLLDYPPSQLPFSSFLSELNEALLMCERGVMCCFQPVKCTARLLRLPPHCTFSLKTRPLAGGGHRSWPFTTVPPPRTPEEHSHPAQLWSTLLCPDLYEFRGFVFFFFLFFLIKQIMSFSSRRNLVKSTKHQLHQVPQCKQICCPVLKEAQSHHVPL